MTGPRHPVLEQTGESRRFAGLAAAPGTASGISRIEVKRLGSVYVAAAGKFESIKDQNQPEL
jgi:hypothetical protein